MTDAADPFFEAYHRDDIAYGETPAPGVQSIIDLSASGEPGQPKALDLGAGRRSGFDRFGEGRLLRDCR